MRRVWLLYKLRDKLNETLKIIICVMLKQTNIFSDIYWFNTVP